MHVPGGDLCHKSFPTSGPTSNASGQWRDPSRTAMIFFSGFIGRKQAMVSSSTPSAQPSPTGMRSPPLQYPRGYKKHRQTVSGHHRRPSPALQ